MRALVVTALLATIASRAAAAERSVRLGLTIDADLERIVGEVEIAFENETRAPLPEVVLRLWPNHFAERPSAVGEVNFHWVYPGDFDPGGMVLDDVRQSGRTIPANGIVLERGHRIARVRLAEPIAPGARGVLAIRFHATVPERFGRFGRVGDWVTLAGAAYPELAHMDREGFREDDPPPTARFLVRLTVPSGADVVVGGLHAPSEDPGGDGWRRVEAELVAPYVPILLAPRLAETVARVPGGLAVWMGPAEDAPAPDGARPMSTDALPEDLADVPRAKLVLEAIEEAARYWQARGLPAPGRTVAVEAPLRLRVATPTPGAVLVSDRAFELPPFERTRKFHVLAVLRAAFAQWTARLVDTREDPADASWVADLVACALVDAYVDEVLGGPEYAGQILGPFAIHPVIDQLLYAPTIPFGDAYFPYVEEADPIREEPERFTNDLPRGRRVQAKLVDLIGRERLDALVVAYLRGRSSLREAANDAAGEDLRWFWRQWLGPYPRVAYRLGEVDLAHGRARIERMGAAIREPVEAAGRTATGEVLRARWDGQGPRGTIAFGRPVESIVLDPDFRLVEDPSLAQNHPRFDDVHPIPWRPPVFNGFVFGLSVSEAQPSLYVDFSMRRLYDLTDVVGFRAVAGGRGSEVSVRYLRGFGRLRDTNARQWYVGPIASFSRWNDTFDVRSEAATSADLVLGIVRDTRGYRYDPWDGTSFAFAGGPAFTVLDRTGETRVSGAMGVRVAQTFTPWPRHTFALFEGAGLGFGELLPAQEQALGGRYLLRGYETDEALGRSAAYAVAEYRWTALAGLDAGAFQLVWARAVQPILFAGAGVVGEPGALLQTRAVYLDAGAGLRLHFDYGGVQQGLVGLDVAVPLSRTVLDWVPDCKTEDNGVRRCFAELGVFLTFDQTF